MAPRRQGPTQTEVVRRSPFAGHSGRGLVIISIASFIMLGTVGFQSVFVEESTSRNTRQHVQQALLHSRGASSEAPDQAIKVVASGGEAGVSRGPSKGLGTTAPPEAAPGAGKFPTSDHWLNMSKPSRDLAGVLKMKNPKNDTDITTIDLTNLPVYKQEVFRGKVTPQTKVPWSRSWNSSTCRPGFGRPKFLPKRNITLKQFQSYKRFKGELPPMVIEEFKLIICPLTKSGSTPIRTMALRMLGRQMYRGKIWMLARDGNFTNNVHTPRGFHHLRVYSFEKAQEILADPKWTTVAFVRNPYTRLASGFRDKVLKMHENRRPMNLRKNTSEDVGPAEFMQLLEKHLNVPNNIHNIDEHWRPMSAACYFDYVDYDFIGKFENFEDDMECILGRLGLWEKYGEIYGKNGVERFPGRPVSGHATSSSKLQVLRELWTENEIQTISKLFKSDFDNFKYSTDPTKLMEISL